MKTPGLPRALLVVGGLAVAIVAGIGTAGSFGGGGNLWGDQYDPGDASGDDESAPTALRAPAIRATIDSMTAAFQAAVNEGESARAAGFYAASAVSSPPGGHAVGGREAIHGSLQETFPVGSHLEITEKDIRVLSPEWATAYGTATLDRDGAGSGEPATEVTYFVLFQKTDDGWKVHREAISANE